MDGILGRIVATVLGLLALGAVAYAGYNAFQNNKAAGVVTDIAQVITNARAGFAQGSTGYTDFITTNEPGLITAGMFPSDMVTGTAPSQKLVDAWGNAVTLAAVTPPTGTTPTQASITIGGNESAQQCTNVVTGLRDYVSIAVGSALPFNQVTPPDAATAGADCANSQVITVTFQ